MHSRTRPNDGGQPRRFDAAAGPIATRSSRRSRERPTHDDPGLQPERTSLAWGRTLLALVVAAALLLIPPLGIAGAGLSVFLAYGLRAAIRSWVLRKHFDFDVPRAHNAAPLAAACCGAGAAWLIGGEWPALAAALAVYALVLASWLKATGQGLALSGFGAAARVTPS